MASFSEEYMQEAVKICQETNYLKVEEMAKELKSIRERAGRLFFLGVGGSAANCSHAVNDFRKLCAIESYSPLDNVAELTARINDEGWTMVFVDWLKASNFSSKDAIFVLSVGGGNKEKGVSENLVHAIDFAKETGASVLGIVGKPDGHAAKSSDHVLVIPQISPERVTPHSEAFQAVIWHLLVSHPDVKTNATKWESLSK